MTKNIEQTKALNKSIGKRIQQARKNRGYTQNQLSELTGISISFISLLERGKQGISAETIISLCDALYITPNDLLLDAHSQILQRPMSNSGSVFSSVAEKHLPLLMEQIRLFIRALSEQP